MRPLLTQQPYSLPMLTIWDTPENAVLIKAFETEYRYKKDGETINKKRRPYCDAMNALEYLVVEEINPISAGVRARRGASRERKAGKCRRGAVRQASRRKLRGRVF